MDQRIDEPKAALPAFLDVASFVRELQALRADLEEIQYKVQRLEAKKTNNHE